MERVAILVTHRTRGGQREAVRAIWHEHMAPAVAANPGHLSYTYCLDDADPDVICAFQVYRDADAAAAFQQTPAYAAYEKAVAPLLAGSPSVQRLTPTWTKLPDASA
ncbi:MAG TPA: antibiotic biosynthesis monooxygenase [Acidimicrobiales bacterium]|jgi:quinol monooxygenase YgiN|nr:antibiotic biosynthesis monooxygenase [Acidimicrobiales bacterium]